MTAFADKPIASFHIFRFAAIGTRNRVIDVEISSVVSPSKVVGARYLFLRSP